MPGRTQTRNGVGITVWLRWWFYQHGRLCAKYPGVAAVIGILAAFLGALGIFNPRGRPFVFQSLQLWRDDIPAALANMASVVQHYAMPRWHFAAYFILVVYITCAADHGVKYSTLTRVRSQLGLKTAAQRAVNRQVEPWQPPFRSRFTVGLCGVLTVLSAIGMSVAVAHSLFGSGMERVFDELPFLILFMGVGSVYALLDASTATFKVSEHQAKQVGEHLPGGEVYVVDRVNQIAMATSLTGPEELLTSFAKGFVVTSLPLDLTKDFVISQFTPPFATCFVALAAAWPLSALVWAPLGDFCVHAGLAVLFKCLIQMSVFASLVQHLLPAWDPQRKGAAPLITPDVKCRVCFEYSTSLRRCPCECTGSVGYIHPLCFQEWFEIKKSMRCELCHGIFKTMESFLSDLLPPLLTRTCLYLILELALLCNKLGFLALERVWDWVTDTLRVPRGGMAVALTSLVFVAPPLLAALAVVLPGTVTEWHRRHRVMQWDNNVRRGVGGRNGEGRAALGETSKCRSDNTQWSEQGASEKSCEYGDGEGDAGLGGGDADIDCARVGTGAGGRLQQLGCWATGLADPGGLHRE